MPVKENCKGCHLPKYIVNRTHMLCDDCNQIRLHGHDRRQIEKNKYTERMNKLNQKRNSTFVKRTNTKISKTDKQKEIDTNYSKVVKEIINEREPFCETCGRTHVNLSISHTISRKRCKEINRIDLITDKKNLVLECFGAPSSNPTECHNLWEIGNLKKLAEINNDMLQKRLEFVEQNDPQGYRILVDKLL